MEKASIFISYCQRLPTSRFFLSLDDSVFLSIIPLSLAAHHEFIGIFLFGYQMYI